MPSTRALVFALWCGVLLNAKISKSRPFSSELLGAAVQLQSTGDTVVDGEDFQLESLPSVELPGEDAPPTLAWKAYLEEFGYLQGVGGVPLSTEWVRGVKSGVSSFQKVYGLPITGNIDPPTLTAMSKRRCGISDQPIAGAVPDPDSPNGDSPDGTPARKRRSIFGSVNPLFVGPKWNKTTITYRIREYTDDMSPYEASLQIEAAFQEWQKHIPVEFHELIVFDADIDIEFATRYHYCDRRFDGRGNVVAHAFYPPNPSAPANPWNTIEGDMHFDDDEIWRTNNSTGGVHLYAVALHEIGHSLGLGHSEEQTSIMWPFDPNPSNYGFLSAGDIAAIQSVYGVRDPPAARK